MIKLKLEIDYKDYTKVYKFKRELEELIKKRTDNDFSVKMKSEENRYE